MSSEALTLESFVLASFFVFCFKNVDFSSPLADACFDLPVDYLLSVSILMLGSLELFVAFYYVPSFSVLYSSILMLFKSILISGLSSLTTK